MDPRLRHWARQPTVGHAVGSQAIDFWQAKLQCMETEHIGYGQIELLTLPR
jgi:hypothetical protein